MLETPSRIWRRIEAVEDHDMPSLPSIPGFDDSAEELEISSEAPAPDNDEDIDLSPIPTPFHSTPAVSSHYASTARSRSSTSSATRFANSIARSARSSAGGGGSTRQTHEDSFDVSPISSLPRISMERGTGHYSSEEDQESKESVPEMYLPPQDAEDANGEDLSISEALQSVSRTSSPYLGDFEPTPKKNADYFVPLRPEPEVRPSHCTVIFTLTYHSRHHLTNSRTFLADGLLPGFGLHLSHIRPFPQPLPLPIQHHIALEIFL